MRFISLIVSFISILLSVHYFYSYRILTSYLKYHHLDYMSIITFEDITLSFGNDNFMIFSISGLGLMWIYLWHLVIINEEKLRKDTKLYFASFFDKISQWIIHNLKIQKKTLSKIKIITTLVLFSIILFFIIFWNYNINKSFNLFILFLINFIVIPIIYILMWKKRELIFVIYLIFIFGFGLSMIDSSYHQQNERKLSDKSVTKIISFDYDSKHYETSMDTTMIFNGYKYLILKTKSKNIYDIFPKEEIKNIKSKIITK